MVKESFFAIFFFFIAKYDKYDSAIVNGHIRFSKTALSTTHKSKQK